MKDEIRQEELEILGVSFLRFNALLVVNKVESVLKEIEKWIYECEESEFVKKRKIKIEGKESRRRS